MRRRPTQALEAFVREPDEAPAAWQLRAGSVLRELAAGFTRVTLPPELAALRATLAGRLGAC